MDAFELQRSDRAGAARALAIKRAAEAAQCCRHFRGGCASAKNYAATAAATASGADGPWLFTPAALRAADFAAAFLRAGTVF